MVVEETSAKPGKSADPAKPADGTPAKSGGAKPAAGTKAKSTAKAKAVKATEAKGAKDAKTSKPADAKPAPKSDAKPGDAKPAAAGKTAAAKSASATKPDEKPDQDAKSNAAGQKPSAPKSAPKQEPKPAAAAQKPAQSPAVKPARGGVFVPMLLGGAIAAAIGFGAARYPDQWPFVTGPVEDPLATELAAQGDQLAAIEEQGKAQAEAIAALQSDDSLNVARGEISGEFAQLRTQLEAMSGKLSELENRIHTVEKLPQGSGMEAAAAAAAAYERELAQMREMLDAELAKISSAKEDAETLEVNAAEAAKAAGARAALARVLAALDTGKPFGDALFDLTQQADVDAPVALASQAETGVPTLAELQASFPDAARAALDASIRAAVEAGEMDRVSAFLRLQLGTRSLSPKEGADPDAVLSRSEAALQTGDLEAALQELAAMPEAGQPALADWIADATARKDALAAGDALAQLVNSK